MIYAAYAGTGNTYCNTDYRFDIEFSRSRSNTVYAYISVEKFKG